MRSRQIINLSSSLLKTSHISTLLRSTYSTTQQNTPKPKRKLVRNLLLGAGLVGLVGSYIIYESLLTAETVEYKIAPTTVKEEESEEGKEPVISKKQKLVILGAGWGACAVLDRIDTRYFDIYIVSPRNYFLFTPLLPSTTVGSVDNRSITNSVRSTIQEKLKKDPNAKIEFFEAACTDIDPNSKEVFCEDVSEFKISGNNKDHFKLSYDKLVFAVGADNSTFNTPGVEKNAFFLKQIDHSKQIHERIIDILESASYPTVSKKDYSSVLNFIVCGGGPTGVEFAAALDDFIHDDVKKKFPHLKCKITLIQSSDHLLNTYDEKISKFTEKHFASESINVLLDTRVVEVKENSVVLFDKKKNQQYEMPCGMVVWATGIAPTNITVKLISKLKESGQNNTKALVTDAHLRVKGAKDIFAIGDCSTIEKKLLIKRGKELFQEADLNKDGVLQLDEVYAFCKSEKLKREFPQLSFILEKATRKQSLIEEACQQKGQVTLEEFTKLLEVADKNLTTLPATAQVANRQGIYLGKLLNIVGQQRLEQNRDEDKLEIEPFKYKHMGSFSYIGRDTAVADLPHSVHLGGFGAFLAWRGVYFAKQVSWKCRVSIAFDWITSAIFGRDVSRL